MYGHKYTNEEKDFMTEYVPGHSYLEIKKAFTDKFGWEITISQVQAYIKNHHLNTGRTGRFEKGHVPPNKGKKGIYIKGSEKGWFKKGNVPRNHRPVGSKRITKDGRIEIKVAEPNKWKLKHRLVYEQYHNVTLGSCDVITFLDNNPLNCDIENLALISRSILRILNEQFLELNRVGDPEIKKAIISLAKNIDAVNKAKRRKNGL